MTCCGKPGSSISRQGHLAASSELKAAAPLCDPHDTEEEAIVASVIRVVRHMEMADQVILNSFSPALLYIAAQRAPEISGSSGCSSSRLPRSRQRCTLRSRPLTSGSTWVYSGPTLGRSTAFPA